MSKLLTTLITFLLLFILCDAQEITSTQENKAQGETGDTETVSMPESRCTVPKSATKDRDLACLKGNVHTVKSEFSVFVKKDGQLIKTAVSATNIATYDKQGNLIENLNYGSKDYGTESETERIVYSFNSQGIATGWEEFNSGNNHIPVKDIYTYDAKGNRIKQTVTYVQAQSILTLTYDSKGNKIEERTYYPVPIVNGDKQNPEFLEKYLDRFTKYKYDGKNLIEITHYDKDGKVVYRGIYSYENGNQKEALGYTLDAMGNLVRSYRTSFRYDDIGNVIEKVIYSNDSIKGRYVDGYDERGFRVSRSIYDGNGRVTSQGTWTYQYDTQGNWLSYTSKDALKSSARIDAGEPFPLELRTITYY